MNPVIKAIKERRSVRRFQEKQVEEASLDTIIEAGTYAPSANNQQTWYFSVVQDPKLLDAINQESKKQMRASDVEKLQKMGSNASFLPTYNAPTLIVVSGLESAMAYKADCSAAIQNMLLAAESLDIGSVWLGITNFAFANEDIVSQLKIPEGYVPFYSVAFGYKESEAKGNGPKRNTDVVTYIR